MQRPAIAGWALSFNPLVETAGTDASGIEGVPTVPTGAGPKVSLAC